MISGLHNQHLPNAHAQRAAKHLNQHQNGQTDVYSPVNGFLFSFFCQFVVLPTCASICAAAVHRSREPVGQRVRLQQPSQTAAQEDVVEGHEGEALLPLVPHAWALVLICSSPVSLLPQMKLIIALVVFALLLIIISECLVHI